MPHTHARAILARQLQMSYLYKTFANGSTETEKDGQSYFTRTTGEAAYGRFPLFFFTTQERTFLVSHSHCITSDTYLGEGDPVYNTQTLQIDKNKKCIELCQTTQTYRQLQHRQLTQ